MNYALTQAQLTHECAVKTFKEYDFAPPMVVLVNDKGVKRFTPDDNIRAQAAALRARTASSAATRSLRLDGLQRPFRAEALQALLDAGSPGVYWKYQFILPSSGFQEITLLV